MSETDLCGCRTTPEGREICAKHLVLVDRQGKPISFAKDVRGMHLGGELEKLKQRKDKR